MASPQKDHMYFIYYSFLRTMSIFEIKLGVFYSLPETAAHTISSTIHF